MRRLAAGLAAVPIVGLSVRALRRARHGDTIFTIAVTSASLLFPIGWTYYLPAVIPSFVRDAAARGLPRISIAAAALMLIPFPLTWLGQPSPVATMTIEQVAGERLGGFRSGEGVSIWVNGVRTIATVILPGDIAQMDPTLLKAAWDVTKLAHPRDVSINVPAMVNAQKFSLDAKLLEPKDTLDKFDGLWTAEFVK